MMMVAMVIGGGATIVGGGAKSRAVVDSFVKPGAPRRLGS